MQICLAGGGLKREIRITASNADYEALGFAEAPTEIPAVAPYRVTFYIELGNEIVSPPPLEYFPGTRALLHNAAEGPRRGWQSVNRSFARVLDGAIAAARAGRFRSASPVEATITSWTMLAAWAVPLSFVVAIAMRCSSRSARRIPRAAPA